jgi:hypothetical protein
MSNYLKATDFGAKDALISGDPNKIVKGTEINDEFDAIQTAVNSKANIASPTFTGTPAAPTATAGTNTTQVATTAFVTTAVATGTDNISTLSAFTLVESGTDLLIKYNGTTVAKITSVGALEVADDIAAYGSL